MIAELLPESRYFVYAEVGEGSSSTPSSLWTAYSCIQSEQFNMATMKGRNEVYPALAKLFQKEQPVAYAMG